MLSPVIEQLSLLIKNIILKCSSEEFYIISTFLNYFALEAEVDAAVNLHCFTLAHAYLPLLVSNSHASTYWNLDLMAHSDTIF